MIFIRFPPRFLLSPGLGCPTNTKKHPSLPGRMPVFSSIRGSTLLAFHHFAMRYRACPVRVSKGGIPRASPARALSLRRPLSASQSPQALSLIIHSDESQYNIRTLGSQRPFDGFFSRGGGEFTNLFCIFLQTFFSSKPLQIEIFVLYLLSIHASGYFSSRFDRWAAAYAYSS